MAERTRRIRVTILPNLVTMGNLFCGFLAIIKIAQALFQSDPELLDKAAFYIFLGMIFDALDGKVARMVKASSDFGAQLDSLCDAISFGVAPAFLAYAAGRLLGSSSIPGIYTEPFLFITSAVYVVCSVLRLARFNVEVGLDEEEHRYFKGMPTPGAAGMIASSMLVFFNPDVIAMTLCEDVRRLILLGLPWYCLICSVLMVSSVRYVHVVSVFMGARVGFEQLVLVVVVATLTYVNFELTLFAALHLYYLTGVITFKRDWFEKLKSRDMDDGDGED
ncbi:MAG: CDP-diacylglycerol--serine O-phosphatidyltransferase [Planctomycetota bacterium]